MPSHKEKKSLPYSAKQMVNLVLDIEKYPEFLPWCSAAKITKRLDENHLNADLAINFKAFFQKYSSDVLLKKISDDEYEIEVKAINGPFKRLVNRWHFRNASRQSSVDSRQLKNSEQWAVGSGQLKEERWCEVEFFIDFEFESFLLEKMIGAVFARATDKMINAFEKRAGELFEK